MGRLLRERRAQRAKNKEYEHTENMAALAAGLGTNRQQNRTIRVQTRGETRQTRALEKTNRAEFKYDADKVAYNNGIDPNENRGMNAFGKMASNIGNSVASIYGGGFKLGGAGGTAGFFSNPLIWLFGLLALLFAFLPKKKKNRGKRG